MKGANPQELDRMIQTYEQMHRQSNPSFSNLSDFEMKSLSQVVSSIGKVQDVTQFLDDKGCCCINDLSPSSFDGFLNGRKLVSGKGSGKLVLVYSFKQKLMVKIGNILWTSTFSQMIAFELMGESCILQLHSFKVKARTDTGPKTLRIFANHPQLLDFNVGTNLVPSQQVVYVLYKLFPQWCYIS